MSRSSKAGAGYRATIRQHDHLATSPLTAHLNYIGSTGDDGADLAEDMRDTVRRLFATDDVLKVLMLLERSVLVSSVPNGAPESALREMNATRNFVLDLRRIASNGE